MEGFGDVHISLHFIFMSPIREEVWGHTCIALFPLGILQGRRCGDIHVSLYFLLVSYKGGSVETYMYRSISSLGIL